jgi:hypothetical protein
MTVTLVLDSETEATLADSLNSSVETAGVLLVRTIEIGDRLKLLARSMHWVGESQYLERSGSHMRIGSSGYVEALAASELDQCTPIWFHTHPTRNSAPLPSDLDALVDSKLADTFRIRSGADYYGTLIFAPDQKGYSYTGSVERDGETRRPIDRIWSVGKRWRLIRPYDALRPTQHAKFERNIQAFGPDIQTVLNDLSVAVVGAGGTGSAVAEQLVRLGIRKLQIVDGDRLSESNVTRVYGSSPADIGRFKVEVLRDHLMRIAPDLQCDALVGMATVKRTAQFLTAADVVFGCTDDNAGRLVLSRLSTYYLLPVIDVGVLLSSDRGGLLSGIDGRITTMTPGAACLVCRNRIDLARAAAELKTPEERKRLADEGYAPALGQTEPAVVAFTTAVASAAVSELLDRLIGFGPTHLPTETLLRFHEREISTNEALPQDRHYCHSKQGKWGAGQEEPFLGQLWPAE